MLQPGGQTHALHGQDPLAPVGKAHRVLGDKGGAGKVPLGNKGRQGPLLIAEGDAHHVLVKGRLPGVHPAALLGEALQVHLGGEEPCGEKLALLQQGAVLRNQIVPGKDHIRSGLAQAAVRIHIGAQQPPRVLAHQLPAVLRLADGLIRAGGVQHQRSPVAGQAHAGGKGAPQVLTDLHPHLQAGHILAAKQQALSQPNPLPGKIHLHRLWGRGEVPGLVKLRVIGNARLGRQAQQLPLVEYGRAVVQGSLPGHGQAHRAEDIQVLCLLHQAGKAPLCRGEQGLIPEQVPAGIGGQGQLRKTHGPAAVCRCLLDQLLNPFQVLFHVRYRDSRGGGGNTEKSIFHKRSSFLAHPNPFRGRRCPTPEAGPANPQRPVQALGTLGTQVTRSPPGREAPWQEPPERAWRVPAWEWPAPE